MKNRIINFLIGNLDSEKLKDEIKNNPNQIIVKDFGAFGGKVYFVKPVNEKATAELIDKLDTQPNGRKTAATINYFVGGPFITARTDDNAIKHHQLFAHNLNRPKDYVDLMLRELKTSLNLRADINLKELISIPIRSALAKGLFNLDRMSLELKNAWQALANLGQEFTPDFGETVLLALIGTYYKCLLKFKPEFRAVRNHYAHAANEFLNTQANKILDDLKKHAADTGYLTKNLLTCSVIQVIKERNPKLVNDATKLNNFLLKLDLSTLNSYLHDSYIQTIPASVLAGDEIVNVISCALTAMATNPLLLAELRHELKELDLFANSTDIVKEIEQNKKANGYLHTWFLEACRRESLQKKPEDLEFATITWRYTENEIDINGSKIPPKSLLAILSAMPRFDKNLWENPDVFNPARFFNHKNLSPYATSIFSLGKRLCPAHKINEYLIKTFIAYIALNYTISLTAKKNEIQLNKINIRLEPYKHKKHLQTDYTDPLRRRYA